jgi:hypothetical protein
MSKEKDFQRVNEAGMVNVVDEKIVGAVPLQVVWAEPRRRLFQLQRFTGQFFPGAIRVQPDDQERHGQHAG